MSKENQREVSRDKISRSYREVFPSTRPTDWKIKHLIYHNALTKSGDVKRTTEVCMESNINGLECFEWRIILPRPIQRRIHGLSVRSSGGELLEYELKYYKKDGIEDSVEPDYGMLIIKFPPLSKGQLATIRFEYFIEKYALRISKGLFSSVWRYSWSYRVHSETHKFEHRVVLPPKSVSLKNMVSTNMPSPPINFSFGESESIIWMADNPNVGDLIGEFQYRQESPLAQSLLSLMGGSFIGGLTSLICGPQTKLVTFLLFLVPVFGIFLTIYLMKKLLPTELDQ